MKRNLLHSTSVLFLCLLMLLSGATIILFGIHESLEAQYLNSQQLRSNKVPVFSARTQTPQLALTFDAGWGNSDTAALLSILDKHNVKATFFLTGHWVDSYPDEVKMISNAGHELGNHSESHKEMCELSPEECRQEILSVHNKVKILTGEEMSLFRPPYGDFNDDVITTANELGYEVIKWNVDSLDWKDLGTDDIVSRVLDHKNLGNGSIILMHNETKYTKYALEQIIVSLQERGFELVPVSQLLEAQY